VMPCTALVILFCKSSNVWGFLGTLSPSGTPTGRNLVEISPASAVATHFSRWVDPGRSPGAYSLFGLTCGTLLRLVGTNNNVHQHASRPQTAAQCLRIRRSSQ
jgi:hypothetical protein